jgi:SAM-dependent methyltransferase
MSASGAEACHGVRQIVRFNWPSYAAASVLVASVPILAPYLPDVTALRAAVLTAAGLAAYWTIASLAVSWIVYDRSPLMSGSWIAGALGYVPAVWVSVHAGLDEFTPILRRRFPRSAGRSFDMFDSRVMTEPSIARARQHAAGESERVDYRRLPAGRGSADAVLMLLSAHELRAREGREDLLREASRVLEPGRRALVAEHLRDLPNIAAFGPGAWHFHSRRTWLRAFDASGLVLADELRLTPFVRIFVLEKPA